MFNQTDDPLELLAWLSERNQHIPVEELAFMLETQSSHDDTEQTESNADNASNGTTTNQNHS